MAIQKICVEQILTREELAKSISTCWNKTSVGLIRNNLSTVYIMERLEKIGIQASFYEISAALDKAIQSNLLRVVARNITVTPLSQNSTGPTYISCEVFFEKNEPEDAEA
ncbi:MAG: hypothetical protein HY506_00585 [Candidatus Yanofskybacteria bacterium]|nr:hypothetical protein [Candidatus Yanofskybacteria bacterium]